MATGSTRDVVPRMMPFDELNDALRQDEWDAVADWARREGDPR